MDIINTLTGNVTKNNTLVDKVLAKIGDLETEKNAALAATGDNANFIKKLNEQIANLTAELNTYKAKLEAANTALAATLDKMVGVVGDVDQVGAVGDVEPAKMVEVVEPATDGKRRKNRKSKSKKTKRSRRSRKSKKRQH